MQSFKELALERSPTWKENCARNIYERYIRVDAPRQVNISAATRETIDRAMLHVSAPKLGVFDDAEYEVADMLRFGAWRDFELSPVHDDSRAARDWSGSRRLSITRTRLGSAGMLL